MAALADVCGRARGVLLRPDETSHEQIEALTAGADALHDLRARPLTRDR
jgi:hypothetical protein